MSGDDFKQWQWEALWASRERAIDDRTLALLEGLCNSLNVCRYTLAMYAHRSDIPALRSAEFWLREARHFIASGIETEGHDHEDGHGAKHESPTRQGDAQNDAPDPPIVGQTP